MCGILGFVAGCQSRFDRRQLRSLLDRLLHLSESRGKEASGVVLTAGPRIDLLKRPVRARTLTRSRDYRALLRAIGKNGLGRPADPLVAMGHTRMVTNGSADIHENNQPVSKHGMLCFHNGIVVNEDVLWQKAVGAERDLAVDTEVILSLIDQFRQRQLGLIGAVRSAFQVMKGANSIALMAEDTNAVILASTNGSLFTAASASGAELIYASEKYILSQALKHPAIEPFFAGAALAQVQPNTGFAIPLDSLEMIPFSLRGGEGRLPELPRRDPARLIIDLKPQRRHERRSSTRSLPRPPASPAGAEKLVAVDGSAIAGLRRCRRCILPATFPLIDFDESGVCNFCRSHRSIPRKGESELLRCIRSTRRGTGGADCLVPLSGGRDSSYALHYIVKVLGMKPIAFTYDWGMVTDLARRNISRMCGELGIEHILISADIRRKRDYIRQNVNAWLRQPDLGAIPLFMAGDKQFFYYANLLRSQMNLGTTLFSMNPLERTDFKSAFCGIRSNRKEKLYWNLSAINKIKLLFYYSRVFTSNPAFLNASLADSLGAYLSYYFLPKKFALIYDYIGWNEAVINDTLTRQYDWEKARDLKSTWRIGDGTAAFYNYIYYRVAGFTENDTFRSNQIREGQITRQEALATINEDNRPRLESIRWYCDTVGVDWLAALRRINEIPVLYPSPI